MARITDRVPPVSRWVFWSTIATVLALNALIIFCRVRFDSLSNTMAFLAGEVIIPDSSAKSYGSVRAGITTKVDFTFKNYLSRSRVVIYGASSSCGCTVVQNSTVALEPLQESPFPILVNTVGRSGPLLSTVTVYYTTEDKSFSNSLILRVDGKVVSK